MKIKTEIYLVVEWVVDHYEFADEVGIFDDEKEAIGFMKGWQRVNGGKYEVWKFNKSPGDIICKTPVEE